MKKRLISLVVFACIGAGVYYYARGDASNRVKKTMLEGLSMMQLSAEDADFVRHQFEIVHPVAFDKALKETANAGAKFDAQLYYDEVKRGILDRASGVGRNELVKTLTDEFEQLKFDVEER